MILGHSINARDTIDNDNFFLGNYGHMEGGTEFYINGSSLKCTNGKTRSATIKLVQGLEAALLDSREPTECSYEFTFQINCKGITLVLQIVHHSKILHPSKKRKKLSM